MPIADVNVKFKWLSRLRQDGLPVSAAVLEEMFPDAQVASDYKYSLLRHRFSSFNAWIENKGIDSRDSAPLYKWIDSVMEEFLNYPQTYWDKGSSVPQHFRKTTVFGEKLSPNRVLYRDIEKKEPAFLMSIDRTKEIGRGKGRTAYGKFLELLRDSGVKLGIITNGVQFRLCYAGLDHDSWVQWDIRNWFEEEELRDELHGFYSLIGHYGTKRRDEHEFPLLDAVEATRTKQGELAGVMSDYVRESVEILIHHLNNSLKKYPGCLEVVYDNNGTGNGNRISQKEVMDAVYQAAVRMVMRLVVVLFAEAKGLLSRSDFAYDNSYGISGYLEQLKNAMRFDGIQSLEERRSGWSRLLALFSLLYEGSHHSSLVIPRYGGLLFKPGNPEDADPVIRALSLFENRLEPDVCRFEIPDSQIYDILIKLTTGKVKVKHGRSSTWVKGPVDFSELRTEYIGMMYEGLLDYELKSSDQVMVFLKLGMEPVLPLDLLESLDDKGLKNLVDKLIKEEKNQKKTGSEEDETGEEDDDSGDMEELEDEEEQAEEGEESDEEQDDETTSSQQDINHGRAVSWALKLVKAGKLVKKAKGKKFDQYHYDRECGNRAKRLIGKVVDAGSMYLARWGGTRKGTGTFYTPPGLAVPTAQRTIEPLVYNVGAACSRDRNTEAACNGNPGSGDSQLQTISLEKPIPRKPEEILSLKVCDPSCGSGSFLVAALKYITDVLYESLIYHYKINEPGNYQKVTLPFGKLTVGTEEEDRVPCPPSDDDFAEKVKQRLRRYVAEWCIYGVDLNPLAVEFCKLSLWIETMDNELPFNFLDHKIKAGNSLTGCWFDRYRDYPALAWLREGGDKAHNGVHYKKEEWTKVIREVYNNRVKPEMAAILEGMTGQLDLPFDDDFMRRQGMDINTHDEAEKIFNEMHNLPLSAKGLEDRERIYRDSFVNNSAVKKLKERFDLWCAVWFWDADQLYERELTEDEKLGIPELEKSYGRKLTSVEIEALKKKKVNANYLLCDEIPTPNFFYKPSGDIMKKVRDLTVRHRFFHWELEFPDVFTKNRSGFNVVLGNPPWDVQKPLSMEFFSNFDPIYRTYGKQEALKKQKELFEQDKGIERYWIQYSTMFKSRGNFVKYAAFPFGDPDANNRRIKWKVNNQKPEDVLTLHKTNKVNEVLHSLWREKRSNRAGFSEKQHPYRYQGSADLNTYKMFLEISHAVMRNKGRLGVIVPSGVYTDKGTTSLRLLFLERCRWEWLFSFENKLSIFNIHKSQKFAPIIIEKFGTTESVKTSFMNHELKSWKDKPVSFLPMKKEQVARFSPVSRVIMEIRRERDLEMVEKIYTHSVLLGEQNKEGWGIEYNTEFHMTNDSKLFDPIGKFITKGYKPDGYGRWVNPDGDIALPLYEGRMVGQFDFSEKGWVSGKGRSAEWRDIPFEEKVIEPQYLMNEETFRKHQQSIRSHKIAFMDVTSATNRRTMISSIICDFPCGHSLPVFYLKSENLINNIYLCLIFNSLVCDYVLKLRGVNLHLTYHILEEIPLLHKFDNMNSFFYYIVKVTSKLILIHKQFALLWLQIKKLLDIDKESNIYSSWAITVHERLRLRCILDAIVAELYGLDFEDFAWILRHAPSDPKGFWRVDKDKDIELRHTTLALAAFRDLKKMGLDEFCRLNDGEGWMIPDTLTFELKEHGVMEFDTENGKTVEVRSRLGERFLPWQLEGTPEESWAECEMHARNILGDDFDDFMRRLNSGNEEEDFDTETGVEKQEQKEPGTEKTYRPVKTTSETDGDSFTDEEGSEYEEQCLNSQVKNAFTGESEKSKQTFTGEPYRETAGKKGKKVKKEMRGQLDLFSDESEVEQMKFL